LPIYVGTTKIKSIYVGTTKIKSVYVGTTKVYSTGLTYYGVATPLSALLFLSREEEIGTFKPEKSLFWG
jgi:hypothetical protein